ncbi:hypothetical protein Hanom_Chr04g00324871 [Helianthus anomalus]
METRFLVSLMLLQAIINGVNLALYPDRQCSKCSKNGNLNPNNILHPDRHCSKCSKNGDLNSNELLKSRDVALDELYKSFRLSFNGAQRSNNGGIWALALCPPKDNMEECPKQKEGASWSILPYSHCMVRYADHPNQGNLAEWAWVQFHALPDRPLADATASELEKAWNTLANTIMEKATTVKNLERYGYGSVRIGPSSQKFYGTMQLLEF